MRSETMGRVGKQTLAGAERDLCAVKGERIVHASGASSSRVPRLDYIPYQSIVRLAGRFELGAAKHGLDNYRQALGDRDYVLERCAHVINHAFKLANKLRGYLPDDGDDDAAAIMWGGAFLCEATEALKKERVIE